MVEGRLESVKNPPHLRQIADLKEKSIIGSRGAMGTGSAGSITGVPGRFFSSTRTHHRPRSEFPGFNSITLISENSVCGQIFINYLRSTASPREHQ